MLESILLAINFSMIYLLGFIPLFSILIYSKQTIKTSLIVSIGFSPVLILGLNTVNVILLLQGNFTQYLIPLLLFFVILFRTQKKNFILFNNIKKIILPIITGLGAGLLYWFFAFSWQLEHGVMYHDLVWNIGIINELKNHFPPIDPHWFSDDIFIYHFLTDSFIAAISNFLNINTILAIKIVNLYTSLSIFVLFAIILENKSFIENIIIFFFILFLSFASGWVPYRSLSGHMSGSAASTFFWALPILITSVYVWTRFNINRSKHLAYKQAITVFIFIFTLYFSKGSFLSVFVFLEFYAGIFFLFSKKISNLKSIAKYKKELSSFFYIPISFLILNTLLPGSEQVSFGIEYRDTSDFNTWSPLLAFTAIYLNLFIFILISKLKNKQIYWEFLLASISNVILFLIIRHKGFSDLYFLFNAIFLNVFFIFFSKFDSILKKYLTSFIISGFIITIFLKYEKIEGFNTFSFDVNEIFHKKNYGDSLYTQERRYKPEFIEYMNFADSIPINAIIASPKHSFNKNYKYSAFIGRRIWNENPTYTNTASSVYTPIYEFQKRTKFIPEFFTDTMTNNDYKKAFAEFQKNFVIDTTIYELSERRYQLYNHFVFDSLPENKYSAIVKNENWTHIIVKNENSDSINDWLKQKKSFKGKFITIYKLSDK